MRQGKNKIKVLDTELKKISQKELNRSNGFMSGELPRFPEYKYFPVFAFFSITR